ncbi:hypothetical protein [Companilactobacillus furfuricola]|uniref:hypothetical protein n=1 Tax=Companilactobacillus furfuricola TaxID=1462575 RepID=UPI0013DDCCC4|nr:hypothetical protein [Companilactobacillus furfuricola]
MRNRIYGGYSTEQPRSGTWWAHFEPIEQRALACFKIAPSSKLLRRQDAFHH